MLFHNEISQENNPNATARLSIQEDGTLFKQYFDFNALTPKNVDNLLVLASDPRLKAIKEPALPIGIDREKPIRADKKGEIPYAHSQAPRALGHR